MIKYTRIAIMTVLIAICSWITIPSTVPFTMQTFAVFAAVMLLGSKDGIAAIGLYLFLGAVGVPVFSGFRGGIAHLLGPTGGYIIGFIFSGLVYMLMEPMIVKNKVWRWPALALGLVLCYLIGTMWFIVVMSGKGTSHTFMSALSLCVFPFIIPDCAKIILAAVISDRVKPVLK